MPTDPAVRSGRRQTLILGASAVAAFILTEYIAGPVLHLEGLWRYPAWFTIGLVLIVVFVTLFTLATERILGPAPGTDE
ncbi:MAG: hypothetical protein ABFC38_10920 [Methanospirillum sp.]